MSDLSFTERSKFEELLGMASGYVLNFSDRTFREFILESTTLDIDEPRYHYATRSKANRLRAFWRKEDNAVVGKLMTDLLDFSNKTGDLEQDCRRIVRRLLSGGPAAQGSDQSSGQSIQKRRQRSGVLRQLNEDFCRLAAESNRNKAGLALEKILNRLFAAFELQPRQPFRVVGEQIDGSFELDGQIYLLESKWKNHCLPEADLLVFRGKIEGKSTFTRGVFIALNGISQQARDAITRGKSPSFFVVDGHDLMMILSETMSLTDFLRKRVRLLAEEGRVSVAFSELAMNGQ